jgi:diguanylate cyclase (GGDEF)-like protein
MVRHRGSFVSANKPVASVWKNLDPYAQLIRSLLPRATSLRVFDAAGELRWSSESTTGPDLPHAVQDSLSQTHEDPSAQGTLIVMDGDTPTYLWWLRDDAGALVAVMAVAMRRQGDGEPQTFSFVNAIAKPAIECLRREIATHDNILRLYQRLDERDKDVELMLSVAERHDDSADQGDELRVLLQNATQHLSCALAVLIVPEKSIAMMRPGEGRNPDGTVLARTHRQLLHIAQTRREVVIINRLTSGPDQQPLPYRLLVCPVRHPSGRSAGVLALFRDIDAQEFEVRDARLGELLSRKAANVIDSSYDALTGLLTRSAMQQRVVSAMTEPGRPAIWSLIYIDADQLHVINDNFGMHVGDQVIAQIGDLVRRRLPPGSLGARISGDRFAVLVPAQFEAAGQLAEGIRQAAAQIGALHGDARLHVSVTIGVAQIDTGKDDFGHVLAEAESACKVGKDRGRNRVELYQDNDVSIIRRYSDITTSTDLRIAIEASRLRLDAQLILPVGAHESAAPPHFECLLRMIDLDGKTIGPDRFLGAARRYQLMPQIDRWVIEEAVRQLRPHADLLVTRPVVFSINFSGQSLNDDEFPDFLLHTIEKSGIEPGVFCFELTESDAVANIAKAELLLRRLRKLGCGVALDDFGTGLSSLAYLRTLPVTMLKIDGSFVRDILKDPRSESMVQAIAQLAHTMSITTVAEYVETEELRNRVAALGVDYAQGFAVGRPLPLPEVLAEIPLYAGASPVYRSVEDVLGSTAGRRAH